MSTTLIVLGIGLALVGGYVGWTWFARHFRGEPNDPQGAEPAIYLLLAGGVALVIAVTLAVEFGWTFLSRLRLV